MFIGRTDAKAEAPIVWPPDAKNWLIGNDPDAGKDWEQGEKGAIENETVGWITDSINRSLSKLQKIMKDREAWCATVHRITKSQTQLSDWTTSADLTAVRGHSWEGKGLCLGLIKILIISWGPRLSFCKYTPRRKFICAAQDFGLSLETCLCLLKGSEKSRQKQFSFFSFSFFLFFFLSLLTHPDPPGTFSLGVNSICPYICQAAQSKFCCHHCGGDCCWDWPIN